MIEIKGKKYERVYSLNTPGKKIAVGVEFKNNSNVIVYYKNDSDNYIILESFSSVSSAKSYCEKINEKLKIIVKAEKYKKDIPSGLY